jgi:hypothetical protein
MKTIALRFSDNIAPSGGTIKAHEEYIKKNGFVWYGKFGSVIAQKFVKTILDNENPKVLLIHSGSVERYWAYVESIQNDTPPKNEWPAYYHDLSPKIHVWLKITKFVPAPKDIMSKCVVFSSNRSLSDASKFSMSPYFCIETED